MKRAARQRVTWLLIVVVLCAVAGWQLQHDRQQAPASLLSLDPASVTRVSLQLGKQPVDHYVLRDAHWWRDDHGTLQRADDLRLGELVRTALAPVQSWRDASQFDPRKIGLEPPQAILQLNDQTLTFGGMTALGQGVYVEVGDRVATVSLRYLPRSAQSLNQNLQAE